MLRLKLRPDSRWVMLYTITTKAIKARVQANLLLMIQWLSEGEISLIIAKIVPLSQAAQA